MMVQHPLIETFLQNLRRSLHRCHHHLLQMMIITTTEETMDRRAKYPLPHPLNHHPLQKQHRFTTDSIMANHLMFPSTIKTTKFTRFIKEKKAECLMSPCITTTNQCK